VENCAGPQDAVIDWGKAACTDEPDLFVNVSLRAKPDSEERSGNEAVEICVRCPIIRQCAREAMEFPEQGCVRGGVIIPSSNRYTIVEETQRKLLFVTQRGRPPTNKELDLFTCTHPQPRKPPTSPDRYTYKLPEQLEYEVMILTKGELPVEHIASRLGLSEWQVQNYRASLLNAGKITEAELAPVRKTRGRKTL
jgi:hypothetical protein